MKKCGCFTGQSPLGLRCMFLVLIFFGMGLSLEAQQGQQLTRFAVVDLSKVYSAFLKESKAVRDLEKLSADIQNEINKRNTEIQGLKSSRLSAESQGNEDHVRRLDNEIRRREDSLKEFYRVKTAELERQKNNLTQSKSFLDQINNEIRIIAETEGYSMILNLKENTGILWHSPTVDVTEKLIQNLLAKSNR